MIHQNTNILTLTQKMLYGLFDKIADIHYCSTTIGLIIHTLVYIVFVCGYMDLKLF